MKSCQDSPNECLSSSKLPEGAKVYTRTTLAFYDFLVHFVSNRLIWGCPTQRLIDHGTTHLTEDHLEIGIGSGKQLCHSAKKRKFHRLVIADVNPDCLQVACQTLRQFGPATLEVDLMDLDLRGHSPFRSIGLNYVLHCLPLDMEEKLAICDRLFEYGLRPGGVLFGATLFSHRGQSWVSRLLMKAYNRKKVFSNETDCPSRFHQWCVQRASSFHFQKIGCVGFFAVEKAGRSL
ncbi:MAG: class I SAM-dependent methyltransferase [Planctomycetota bacterium]|nr:class I SAM-dependent methyltransferase [Planctomycetota bacterium]